MVEYLEVFGTKYPVRIGYYVMKKVKEETGMSFQEALQKADEDGDVEIYETILWYAIRMGSYAEHQDMDVVEIDRDDIPMMLDMVFPEFIQLFSSETFFPKKLRKMAAETEKKNIENGTKTRTKTRTKKPQKKT